jgi:hypothetical protein
MFHVSNENNVISHSYSYYLKQIDDNDATNLYHRLYIVELNKVVKFKRFFSESFYCCFELCKKYDISKRSGLFVTRNPHDFKTNSYFWGKFGEQHYHFMYLNYEFESDPLIQYQNLCLYAMQIIKSLQFGGNCILKIDQLTQSAFISIVYVYKILFKEFTLEKPEISNPLNNDHYIVLKNYQGCPDKPQLLLRTLKCCLKSGEILSICKVPIDFMNIIEEFNIIAGRKTIESLVKLQSSRRHVFLNDQINACISWFKKYDFQNIDVEDREIQWKRNSNI